MAGGFDDWFLDTDSELTMDDLEELFRSSYFANGGDKVSSVDALSEPGKVLLKKTEGSYPLSGELLTKASPCPFPARAGLLLRRNTKQE